MTVAPRHAVRALLAAALLLDVAYSYTIAVVGRPNVGKSTIFNRVTSKFGGGALVRLGPLKPAHAIASHGSSLSQVFDEPGVTRDRTYGQGFWGAHEFTVVDTGGLVRVACWKGRLAAPAAPHGRSWAAAAPCTREGHLRRSVPAERLRGGRRG